VKSTIHKISHLTFANLEVQFLMSVKLHVVIKGGYACGDISYFLEYC